MNMEINFITNKINNGEGSIGLLLKDEKIYDNFEKSTRELSELLEDIKRHLESKGVKVS